MGLDECVCVCVCLGVSASVARASLKFAEERAVCMHPIGRSSFICAFYRAVVVQFLIAKLRSTRDIS